MSEPEITIRAWDSGQTIDIEYVDEHGRHVEEFQGWIRFRDSATGIDVYGRYFTTSPNIENFGRGSFGNIPVTGSGNSPFRMLYGEVRNIEYVDENGRQIDLLQEFVQSISEVTGVPTRFLNCNLEAPEPEGPYPDDIPGMTLDEFQAWSDQIIREANGDE